MGREAEPSLGFVCEGRAGSTALPCTCGRGLHSSWIRARQARDRREKEKERMLKEGGGGEMRKRSGRGCTVGGTTKLLGGLPTHCYVLLWTHLTLSFFLGQQPLAGNNL